MANHSPIIVQYPDEKSLHVYIGTRGKFNLFVVMGLKYTSWIVKRLYKDCNNHSIYNPPTIHLQPMCTGAQVARGSYGNNSEGDGVIPS